MIQSHIVILVLLTSIASPEHGETTEIPLISVALPANPIDSDVRVYLDRIAAFAGKMEVKAGEASPIVEKLASVPSRWFHEVLKRRERFGSHFPLFLEQYAPKYKSQIILHLPRNSELLFTIDKQGWHQEAQREIVLAMADDPLMRSMRMIKIAAKSQAPDLFYLLVGRVYAGPYPNHTLTQLYTYYPDRLLDVRAALGPLRQRSGPSKIWSGNFIRFGLREELDGFLERHRRLISQYDELVAAGNASAGWDVKRALQELSKTVISYVDYSGKPEDFLEWYDANHEAIKFDVASRKYRIVR